MKKHWGVYTIVVACASAISSVAALLGLDLKIALYGVAMVAVSAAAALIVCYVMMHDYVQIDREMRRPDLFDEATKWTPPLAYDYRVVNATQALNRAGVPFTLKNGGFVISVRMFCNSRYKAADFYPTTRKWRLVDQPDAVAVNGSVEDFIEWVQS